MSKPPVPPPPVNIQVCFQGGGAKIAALLVAAAVLQDLEQIKKQVKITRITGTSAGAIVAALLAADCNIQDVIVNLAGQGGEKLGDKFSPPGAFDLGRTAVRGTPIWDPAPLAIWLEQRLKKARLKDVHGKPLVPRTFRDLPIPVTVVCANLDSGMPEERTGGTEIISSVLESAGIPFFFRTWKAGGNTLVVDGGLCGNLPVDELLRNIGDGRIVAFSFEDQRPERPRTLLGFATSLLDQAISHSVDIARTRVGVSSVCVLKPDPPLDTFGFADARAFLANDTRCGLVTNQVRAWFDAFLKPPPDSSVKHDFWHEKNAILHDHMRTIGRIFGIQQSTQKIRYHEIKMSVVANCLAQVGQEGFQQQDIITYEYHFEPLDVPLFAQRLTLTAPCSSDFSGKYAVTLYDDKSKPVDVAVVPSISVERPTDRELIGYFLPPLRPGTGIYHLRLTDRGINTLSGILTAQATDYIELGLSLADGSDIPRLLLVVYVPDTFRALSIKATENIPAGAHRKLTPGEAVKHLSALPPEFRAEIWEIGPFPLPSKPLRVCIG